MLRLADKARYLATPRVPREQIRFLWYVDYWDGPLNGVCEWNDELLWFDSVAEEVPRQREFFLIRLPAAEMARAEAQQALWEKWFPESRHRWGDEASRDAGVPLTPGYLTQVEATHAAYKREAADLPEADISAGQPVGWSLWQEA